MPDRSHGSNKKSSAVARVAVVTGGSNGIGLAMAQALSEAGYRVAIGARNVRQLGPTMLAEHLDVRDEASVAAFFTAVKKRFRRIDVLVNNAGIAGPTRNVAELPPVEWRSVIDTNLTGMFLCTRAALPLMKRGACIVNNLSVSAKGVFPGMSAYNASKHGAAGFTNTLREELRKQGIRVIGLYPGATDTAIWQQFWPKAPRHRMMSAETIAQAVVYAVSTPPESTVEELVITPTGGAL